MQEKQEWSGTPKQFKEFICSRFPNEFASWYRAPYKYVDELKKIAPELRVEGHSSRCSSRNHPGHP